MLSILSYKNEGSVITVSKIFNVEEAPVYENEGVYKMYVLAGKQLGAKNFTAVMYDYEPDWTTKTTHIHDARESVYVILEGKARIHLNGEEHELEAGKVVYLSPGDMHGVIGSGPEGLKMIEVWAPQDPDITYYEDGKVVE